MTTTTRAIQTAAGRTKKEARVALKRASVPNPDAAIGGKPLKGAARFVARNGSRFFRIKIAQLPDGVDPADDARTEACVAALGTPYLQFSEAAYATKHPDVIAWLRGRIALRRLPNVAEDLSMLDIPCSFNCGETFKNTEQGVMERYEHELTVHQSLGAPAAAAEE